MVANAGLAFVGTVETQPMDQCERTIDVNLLGVFRTVRATAPARPRAPRLHADVASLSAVMHAPLMSAYTATKAGVEALGDALRAELAPTGTKVGVAYFGFIDTDLVRGAYEHPATQAMNRQQPRRSRRPCRSRRPSTRSRRASPAARTRLWAPRFVGPAIRCAACCSR